MRNVTAKHSLLLNQLVFQENKICNFKIHLFSILNIKQTNDHIFSNKIGKIFNLIKIIWNVKVRL